MYLLYNMDHRSNEDVFDSLFHSSFEVVEKGFKPKTRFKIHRFEMSEATVLPTPPEQE